MERIGRGKSTGDADLEGNVSDSLELRFWASYRGQTLARTGLEFNFVLVDFLIYVECHCEMLLMLVLCM